MNKHIIHPKQLFLILLTIPIFFFGCGPVQQQRQSGMDARVDSLLALMTLEEKIGQMNQYNGFWEVTGPAPEEGVAKQKYDQLKQGLVGSMLNVTGVKNVRKLQEIAVKETRLGIPLIFGYDVIHGFNTIAPIPLAESASWDLKAIEQSARVAAIEASALGINWTFAPMVDISRDARWGRIMEGAGEDPYLGSKVARARVRGFQGDDLSAFNTIAATVKHFAGYGFVEAGRDYNTVDVGTSTLFNVILPPFKAAVDANVRTVMNAFNVLNGIPATGNSFLLRDILKGEWNFDGFVVSDWGSCAEMVTHGFAKDLKQAAAIAANAGSDMDMESYAYVKYLKSLVNEGKVSEGVIDEAAGRILRVKFEMGLMDDPYKYCDPEREKTQAHNPDHYTTVLDIAQKSIVLLKNDHSLLPLKKSRQGILVIGDLADDKNSPLGSWRPATADGSAVSLLEGLSGYGVNYSYERGVKLFNGVPDFIHPIRINRTDHSGIREAVNKAKNAGVVLMVLGEHGYQSGEGRSRAHIGLPGLQEEMLEAVYQVNKNIVLILMNGRPLAIPWAAEHIPAILECWQLGASAGEAITRVLFGAYNPSGKLTLSFPRSVGQLPLYYNHFNTGRPDSINLVFWSHYADESNSPQFPFGFGLSYTKFTYSDLKIDTTDMNDIRVSVVVKNDGDREGEEVTQLYIHDRVASVVRPVKELKAFEKFELNPGESKKIEFHLTDRELGFYDNNGKFVVESGAFDVMVGTSSTEGLTGTFTLR